VEEMQQNDENVNIIWSQKYAPFRTLKKKEKSQKIKQITTFFYFLSN